LWTQVFHKTRGVGVTDESARQTVLFPDLLDKPVLAAFDEPHTSSDGGAILLKAIDRKLKLTDALTASVRDARDEAKVQHTLRDLMAQRIYGIACGYPDANDADALAEDPLQKLLLGRDPISGERLASQPTLSRFENRATTRSLYRMAEALMSTVVGHHQRRLHGRARRITVDLDATDDPTHGAQQLSFFNGHYDTWCYLPLLAFVTFNDEPDQYLVAAMLRPGNAGGADGVPGLLKRLLLCLWQAFPKAQIRVRLDGGFATPFVFDLLDTAKVEYVVAMGANSVLTREAAPYLEQIRGAATAAHETTKTYGECQYRTRSWPHHRRVIIKAEIVCLVGRDPQDNPRFVVTNLRQTPQWIYEKVYCARGEIENRIKELHDGLQIDRTSCSRFLPNQLRVLLTAAAYVLMQELRRRARRTAYARAQVTTLRERFFKLGVRLVVSVRRVVLHLPAACPSLHAWRSIALACGASTG
jgi:hypothetical protein